MDLKPVMMTVNPRKTMRYRDLGRVDIAALRAAVLQIPEATWTAEDEGKPNRFDALDRTSHIVFRFLHTLKDWRTSYDAPLWAEWRPLLEPVLQAAAAPYGYARGIFPRVMLARMAPGGVIIPHQDAGPAAKWPHKVHIPLVTNDKVTFFVDAMPRHIAEGEVVEVNNMAPHSVKNEGATDRIHLIFEYYDADQPEPAWIDELQAFIKAKAAQEA